MAVSEERFLSWLDSISADYSEHVLNVREVGRAYPNGLYVGRAMRSEHPNVGRFGNPFYEIQHGRFGAIRKYVGYLMALPQEQKLALLWDIREHLDQGGKLLCWCAPLPCHAHVLAGWAMQLDVISGGGVGGSGAAGDSAPDPVLPQGDEPLPQAEEEPTDLFEELEANACQTLAHEPIQTTRGPRFASSAR